MEVHTIFPGKFHENAGFSMAICLFTGMYSSTGSWLQPSTVSGTLKILKIINHEPWTAYWKSSSINKFIVHPGKLIWNPKSWRFGRWFYSFPIGDFQVPSLKFPGSFSRFFFQDFFLVKHAIFWPWRFRRFRKVSFPSPGGPMVVQCNNQRPKNPSVFYCAQLESFFFTGLDG